LINRPGCLTADEADIAVSVAVVGTVSGGQVELDATPGQLGGGHPFRFAFGRVGARVRSVTVELAGGEVIQARCGGGSCLTLWPGPSDPVVIRAYDAWGRLLLSGGRGSA